MAGSKESPPNFWACPWLGKASGLLEAAAGAVVPAVVALDFSDIRKKGVLLSLHVRYQGVRKGVIAQHVSLCQFPACISHELNSSVSRPTEVRTTMT